MERPRINDLFALLVGLALWTTTATNRSLAEDEFHTLHHTRPAELGDFFAVVRSDNHPPLAFLVYRASTGLFGESHLALRMPAVLGAVGLLLLTLRVARRLPDARAAALAPWLLVLSSYVLVLLVNARMYVFLALTVLGLLEAALTWLDGKGSRWWVALWIALGLHLHYYFLHDLFALAVGLLAVAWMRPDLRRRARGLIAPAMVGGAAFLPWAALGLAAQIRSGLPPGGTYGDPWAWCQSLAHLLFLQASLGGKLVTLGIALPGAAAAAVLGLLGLRRLWGADTRPLLVLLVATAIFAPAWAYGVSLVWSHASYNWHYIAGSCVPLLLLVAAGIGAPGWRTVPALVVLATMSVVTGVNLRSAGWEDYRGVVHHVLARAQPGDAIVVKPIWPQDPARSPTGWDYYLVRESPAPETVPERIPIADFRRAAAHDRVWVFVRYRYNEWFDVFELLRHDHPHEEVWPIGRAMWVHLLSR
ncbi:MAG: glycosyltransferase family 39 protein [Proteobacteria bacterium]|nr:glycosyltransferase family 39 protein [Pseudomonadota bacterium]